MRLDAAWVYFYTCVLLLLILHEEGVFGCNKVLQVSAALRSKDVIFMVGEEVKQRMEMT